MRTTLDIATDVLQAAKERARREENGRGSDLRAARSASTAPPQARSAQEPKAVYGFRPFPKRGGIVTNALIDTLREDDAY